MSENNELENGSNEQDLNEIQNQVQNDELDENLKNEQGQDKKTDVVDKGSNADELKNDDSEIFGAPEVYDYKDVKLPQGMDYDKDMLKEFDALNKQTNLSQAQANKYMELGVRIAQKNAENIPAIMKQVQQAKITQFQQALNTDEEIGGGNQTKMNEYLDIADKGYAAFANEEVKNVLAEYGLNYHPEIVKMFHRIGKLVGDDKIYAPTTPAGTPADNAEVLYGSK